MEIERSICYYEKNGESYIGEYNIDSISFDILSSLFNPPKEDPLLYDVYEINKEKSLIIQKEIDLTFDFEKYDYFLECFQK